MAGEPIEAKRDSAGYVLRKALRKHRYVLGAAGAFVLLLLAGLGVSLSFWRDAARARDAESKAHDAAQTELENTLRARAKADAESANAQRARAKADTESANAQAVTEFFQYTLGLTDPANTGGETVTIHRMLDLAAEKLDQSFANQPEAEARARFTIGKAYNGLGDKLNAKKQLLRALKLQQQTQGDDHPDMWPTLAMLSYVIADGFDAIALGAFEWCVRKLRATHPDMADDLAKQWQLTAPRTDATLEAFCQRYRDVLGSDDPAMIYVGRGLGLISVYLSQDRNQGTRARGQQYAIECVDIMRQRSLENALELWPMLRVAADAHFRRENYQKALPLYLDLLAIYQRQNSIDFPSIGEVTSWIGFCNAELGDDAQAERFLTEGYQRLRNAVGADNYRTWAARSRILAWGVSRDRSERALEIIGQSGGRAEALHELAVSPWIADYAVLLAQEREFPELVAAHRRLRGLIEGGDPGASIRTINAAFDDFLELRRRLLPDDDPRAILNAHLETIWAAKYQGAAECEQGQIVQDGPNPADNWIKVNSDSVAIYRANPNHNPRLYAVALLDRAYAHLRRAEFVECERDVRETIDVFSSLPPAQRSEKCPDCLGRSLLGQRRFDEAEPWLLEGYRHFLTSRGRGDGLTSEAWGNLVHLYVRWGRPESASTLAEEYLDALLSAGNTDFSILESGGWVAQYADLSPRTYELALAAAQRAAAREPDSPGAAAALGAAQYRVGQYEPAVANLTRAEQLQKSDGRPADFTTLAFLAMAQFKLGHVDAARETLARSQKALLETDGPTEDWWMGYMQEAERMLAQE